jgi:hypothetical protein
MAATAAAMPVGFVIYNCWCDNSELKQVRLGPDTKGDFVDLTVGHAWQLWGSKPWQPQLFKVNLPVLVWNIHPFSAE